MRTVSDCQNWRDNLCKHNECECEQVCQNWVPPFTFEPMMNEYGSVYGRKYILESVEGKDESDAITALIEHVIGEDYYYGPRDVWDQIEIICKK